MKRLLLFGFVVGILLAAVGLSRSTPQPGTSSELPLQVAVESRNPWTHLQQGQQRRGNRERDGLGVNHGSARSSSAGRCREAYSRISWVPWLENSAAVY